MFRRQRDSDAGRDVHFIAFDIERLRDEVDHAICKLDGGFALVAFADLDNGEFVAAEPRQDVGLPQRAFEARGGFAQQRVTGRVAKRIVDVFEPIEVEQEHRELLAPPALACARVLDFFNRGGAVGEAGEGVVVRHEGNALLGPFPLSDVFDDQREVFRLALLVADDDAAGCQHARAAQRYFHFVFGRGHAAVELDRLAVRLVENRRVLRACKCPAHACRSARPAACRPWPRIAGSPERI